MKAYLWPLELGGLPQVVQFDEEVLGLVAVGGEIGETMACVNMTEIITWTKRF